MREGDVGVKWEQILPSLDARLSSTLELLSGQEGNQTVLAFSVVEEHVLDRDMSSFFSLTRRSFPEFRKHSQTRFFQSARSLFQEDSKPSSLSEQAESTSFPQTEPTSTSTPSSDAAQEPAAAATPTPAEAPKGIEQNADDVKDRTVFVGGLSWNVDNQWLEDEVLKALDLEEGVSSVRIARNHLGKSKGYVISFPLRITYSERANG